MSIIDDVTSGIFKKSGGSILEDAFGYEGSTLTGYLDTVFDASQPHASVLKFFYQQLYRDFSPDINGYTLIFFVPPDLSGYNKMRSDLYSQVNRDSYMNTVGRIMTFAAVDFTPPQSQVRASSVTTRSGSVPIASEVSETDTCSITFVDNRHLDIYMFHHIWVEYIREVLEGTIEPDPSYFTSDDDLMSTDMLGADIAGLITGGTYGAIDYAASFYIVKYRPDMKTVTFVAKCVGVFPQSLPNKELIGTRTANEIVTLPFTYSVSGYREALYTEKSDHWLFGELDQTISAFTMQDGNGMFGGFLGGVLNNVIGPTSGMLNNLTGNAAKLGGIVGNTQRGVSSMWKSISGVANGSTSLISFNK